MVTTDISALSTQFTTAIGDLKAPVLAIMGAGIAIMILFVAFRLMKSTTKAAVK